MTAPNPAPMEKCDPKCRCPSGPYANQAFSCDAPCGEGCTWLGCTLGCNCLEGDWVYSGTQTNSKQSGEIASEVCDPPTRYVSAVISQDQLNQGYRIRLSGSGTSFNCVGVGDGTPPAMASVVCTPIGPPFCSGKSFGCSMSRILLDENGDIEDSTTLIGSAECQCPTSTQSGEVIESPCPGCSLEGVWVFIPD